MTNTKQNLLQSSCLEFMKFLFFTLTLCLPAFLVFASPLDSKTKIIDKYLQTKNPFEKKVKALVTFQTWADKEILTNSDKLSEAELTLLMQYSNLLKALTPSKITIHNCKSGSIKIQEADQSPVSDKLSQPAQTITNWLKLLCPK